MLTIHRAHGVRVTEDADPLPGHAVVVENGRFAETGPYERLLARYGERARTREWEGVLGPGRYEPDAAVLLEGAYWPDPREADLLGTGPLTGEALDALGMTDTRWGASARRGIQRLLARGTTLLGGSFTRAPVLMAVERSGIRRHPAGTEAPGQRAVTPGAPADFAVFLASSQGPCLATALGGRLVFRGRPPGTAP